MAAPNNKADFIKDVVERGNIGTTTVNNPQYNAYLQQVNEQQRQAQEAAEAAVQAQWDNSGQQRFGVVDPTAAAAQQAADQQAQAAAAQQGVVTEQQVQQAQAQEAADAAALEAAAQQAGGGSQPDGELPPAGQQGGKTGNGQQANAQQLVDKYKTGTNKVTVTTSNGGFGGVQEMVDEQIAKEQEQREILAKHLADTQEEAEAILASPKSTKELIQDLNERGWPMTDIYKMIYERPKPELDEKQQKRAQLMAGLSDALASIIEGASTAAGATIQTRQPGSSLSKTQAQIDEAKARDFNRLELYNQGLLKSQAADISEAQKIEQDIAKAKYDRLKAVMDGDHARIKELDKHIQKLEDYKLSVALEESKGRTTISVGPGSTGGSRGSGSGSGRSSSRSSSSTSRTSSSSGIPVTLHDSRGDTFERLVPKKRFDQYRSVLAQELRVLMNSDNDIEREMAESYIESIGGYVDGSGRIHLPNDAAIAMMPLPPRATKAMANAARQYLGVNYGGQYVASSMTFE